MKKYQILAFLLISLICNIYSQNIIDLQGNWSFTTDKSNIGIENGWSKQLLNDNIMLPGSMAENKKGDKTVGSDFGILTPEYKYVGVAWYNREIDIPKDWKKKEIVLFLERVLWESKVFIDGKELSTQDALGTPHIHRLGKLKPGKHILSVRVNNDMIHNIGDKGHAYGEYTQSIWNGIVGRIELMAHDPLYIKRKKIVSDIKNDKLILNIDIESPKNIKKGNLDIEIKEIFGNNILLSDTKNVKLAKGNNSVKYEIDLKGKLRKWSEFNPKTYLIKATIKGKKFSHNIDTEFGYRTVSHNGTKILINNKPVFLRGNLDCVHFPQTGYVSCNVKDWVKIFQTYKNYGLNHVRYHSWCPPSAAFIAADRVGIYIQAEASLWIDWWMSADNSKRGRPEMDTKGRPKGLGSNPDTDKFVEDELNRVVDYYINHPSFIMTCIGNELGNSDFELMGKWISKLKKRNPEILYSASTARKINKSDDYCATHYIKGVGGTRGLRGAKTDWDFENVYSKMDIPIIAHEIGQWPVYPKWSEINKYKGVLKARNLKGFKKVAEKNGILDQDIDFCMASGALNQIMYKYETESFLRTPSCAGVQLLSMQDYQGQGEALIGWLDANWESKGITTPEKFRNHFNTTVPLLKLPKFVWENNEILKAKVMISHHGEFPVSEQVNYKITDEENAVLSESSLGNINLNVGDVIDIAEINFDLGNIKKAKKLNIKIWLKDTEFSNNWNIWVYPTENEVSFGDVKVVKEINDDIVSMLEKGAKVLLVANKCGDESNSVKAHFYPLYWSLTFFPGQGKTNIGLLLQDNHSLFKDFPTSYHSDWQWESISKDSKAFVLNDMSTDFKPIAQPVDDFHRNNKMGSIFEFKVGKGKLLVCGYDINTDKPVAKQLKKSIVNYMKSGSFAPDYEVEVRTLKKMFTFVPEAVKANVPEEFKNAVLYIKAASELDEENKDLPWKSNYDKVLVSKKSKYELKGAGIWKDKKGTAWHGSDLELNIDCSEGMLGSLYVHLHDWNNQNRSGLLDFEGRKVKLGKHNGKGQWVKFHVMREDSNDGNLKLKAKVTNGGNLMITKVVLVEE